MLHFLCTLTMNDSCSQFFHHSFSSKYCQWQLMQNSFLTAPNFLIWSVKADAILREGRERQSVVLEISTKKREKKRENLKLHIFKNCALSINNKPWKINSSIDNFNVQKKNIRKMKTSKIQLRSLKSGLSDNRIWKKGQRRQDFHKVLKSRWLRQPNLKPMEEIALNVRFG